ncbi:MAG: polysaccharide biosynthesis tyrosine autokinase [Bacteroidales bacterium]|nr:polysaccharide biosynthesis tyrosine autokinase [Bacteroidales bacterium]
MDQYQNNNDYQNNESNLSFKDLLTYAWGIKWWCLLSVVACLLLAGLYIYRHPATYTRTAKIIVDENGQSSALKDITSFSNTLYRRSTFTSGVNVYNEVEALASPDLMEYVICKLGLETEYYEKQLLREIPLDSKKPFQMELIESDVRGSFSMTVRKTGEDSFILDKFKINGKKFDCSAVEGHFRDTIQTGIGSLILYGTDELKDWKNDIVIQWCNAHIRAKSFSKRLGANVADKRNSVVVLTFRDVHAKKAENVLASLIDSYNNQWIENANKTANNTSKFIDDRLIVIERELGEIENALKAFKEEHKITDLQNEAQLYIKQVGEYAEKSFEANNQLSIARYLRDYVADPANEAELIPSNLGLQSISAESQIAEYNKILLNRDMLRRNSSENNPLIIDLNESLAAIRTSVIRSMDNLISQYTIAADKIKAQESKLLSRIAGNTGEELQLLSIQRQQKVKESLYIYLLQKREENELASMVNVANTRIIQAPTGGNASSRSSFIILLAFIMGICAPIGILIIWRNIDNKVRSREDLKGVTIPFLAEIPLMKGEEQNRQVIVKADSRDTMNEAYRVLRTNLDLMAGRDHKIFLFTSFVPGSGKTFSIMNVAQSMAIKGAKTLLVDLDLRKGSMSAAIQSSDRGVSTFLNGKDDKLGELILSIDNQLDLLPAGNLPPNPAELLLSDKFEKMVQALREKYDYIFFDCPPIDIVADTSIIARQTDITIFTLRAGMFEKQDLPYIESLYRQAKYPHMALILNGTDSHHTRYGGYGYYYESYNKQGKKKSRKK